MNRVIVAVSMLVLAAPALAAQEKTGTQKSGAQKSSAGSTAGEKSGQAGASSDDPMAGWVARKVTNEAKTRKEIHAFLNEMDQVSRKGDVDAAMALIDFPVLMVTDNAKGEVMAGQFSEEQWKQMMGPMYEKPMPKEMRVAHKATITPLTDSLASVSDDWSMTVSGKKMTGRSHMLLVKVDGKWRAKSMVEGGWGDAMGGEGQGAQGGTSGAGMSGSAGGTSGSMGGTSGSSGMSGSGGTSGSMGGTSSGTSGSSGTTGGASGSGASGSSGGASGSSSGTQGSGSQPPGSQGSTGTK
jgi:hypothetical protein